MTTGTADIGLIGLGTMGAALSANIAEKGFRIAVWNRSPETTRDFVANAGPLAERIVPTETLAELVAAIKPPRAVILLVPAGPIVDQQIALLRPLMAADDLIIDAGNADFHDTDRRTAEAAAQGPHFMGIGVSGGEEGARHGPSIMAGGTDGDWVRVAPVLTAVAARYDGTPCAVHMGPGGAGHFVKAVHNGIEYADMQMIAEIYGVLRDGMGQGAAQIAPLFRHWNEGALHSYLIEITAEVAATTDPGTGLPLLDVIRDTAGQKGTGRWTAIEAQHLGVAVPAIEAAVAARNLSAALADRQAGEALYGPAPQRLGAGAPTPDVLEQALIAGKILCYAQGFDMLARARRQFSWPLPLPDIARVWRAGCIIRSAMLNDMATALAEDPARNLMLAPHFADHLMRAVPCLRQVVALAALNGLPVPALSAGLAWFDQMRTARSTANMIQGQRDFFGAHGFERVDGTTGQHGPWVRD